MKGERIIDESIDLNLQGAVASVVSQLVGQAITQALDSDLVRSAVGSFLEGQNRPPDEQWRLQLKGLHFDESAQCLRITGLELRLIQ